MLVVRPLHDSSADPHFSDHCWMIDSADAGSLIWLLVGDGKGMSPSKQDAHVVAMPGRISRSDSHADEKGSTRQLFRGAARAFLDESLCN